MVADLRSIVPFVALARLYMVARRRRSRALHAAIDRCAEVLGVPRTAIGYKVVSLRHAGVSAGDEDVPALARIVSEAVLECVYEQGAGDAGAADAVLSACEVGA